MLKNGGDRSGGDGVVALIRNENNDGFGAGMGGGGAVGEDGGGPGRDN